MILLLNFTGFGLPIRLAYKTLIPHPGGIGGIFRGPNSETFVKGPDGSVISAEYVGALLERRIAVDPISVASLEAAIPVTDAPKQQEVDTVPLNPASVTFSQTVAKTKRIYDSSRGTGTVAEPNLLPNISPNIPPIKYISSALPLGHSTIVVETEIPLAPGNIGASSIPQIRKSNLISPRGSPLQLNARIQPYPLLSNTVPRISNNRSFEYSTVRNMDEMVSTTYEESSTSIPFITSTVSTDSTISEPGVTIFGSVLSSPSVEAPFIRNGSIKRIETNLISSSPVPQTSNQNQITSKTDQNTRLIFQQDLNTHLINSQWNSRQTVPTTSYSKSANAHPNLVLRAPISQNTNSVLALTAERALSSLDSSGEKSFQSVGPLQTVRQPSQLSNNIRTSQSSVLFTPEVSDRNIPRGLTARISINKEQAPIEKGRFGTAPNVANPVSDSGISTNGVLTPQIFSRTGTASFKPHPKINNYQLVVDATKIPARNIIPPEIGILPSQLTSSVDLKSTTEMFTFPRAPGIVTSTVKPEIGIQNSVVSNSSVLINQETTRSNSNNNVSLNQLQVHSSKATVSSNSAGAPISSEGILSYHLRQQGVDPSQIIFSEVPLSAVTAVDPSVNRNDTSLSQNVDFYEDSSIVLANRYGRKADK